MAKCRRCGSVKGVGRVKTMSPGYAREWHQDTPTSGHWSGGFSKEFDCCMSCILKLEPWLEGKDFRLPGQSALEFDGTRGTNTGSTGPSGALLVWLFGAGTWEERALRLA